MQGTTVSLTSEDKQEILRLAKKWELNPEEKSIHQWLRRAKVKGEAVELSVRIQAVLGSRFDLTGSCFIGSFCRVV
jgi:phosphomevalonate kinase